MRRNVFILVLILLLILFAIYKNTDKPDTNKNYVYIEDNEELVIENILPLSDEVGSSFSRSNSKSNVYYKFKIKNSYEDKVKYKILLKTKNGKDFINDRYVKILLSDKNNVTKKEYIADTTKTIIGLNKFNNKYVVYSGSLKGNGEEEFILRLWISNASTYDDELIFDGQLSVYSY